MKILKSLILCIAAVATAITARAEEFTFSVDKIWDNGMHCAFTSIEKFNDTYYICFREGYSHVFNSQGEADGKIRILCSKNGKKWKSLLLLSKEGYDLRCKIINYARWSIDDKYGRIHLSQQEVGWA